MTAESDILDALFSHVEDLPFSPPIPIAWPNFAFTPSVGTTYIEARLLPNDTDRIMVNDITDRMYGILMLTINSPLNEGAEDANENAASIVSHFATDTFIYSGDNKLRITKRPVVKEGININGWWKTPVLIYYEVFV